MRDYVRGAVHSVSPGLPHRRDIAELAEMASEIGDLIGSLDGHFQSRLIGKCV